VPLFVFDDRLLTGGRFPSAPRTAFMLGCLRELDAALRERGGRLVVRHGTPEREVTRLTERYRAVAG
jgi:deoxyribodipyrimidine photo-lyase